MKVILSDDVTNLGHKGDVVSVADGYARNYLVPHGLALVATRGSLRQAEQMQRARDEQARREREEAAAKVSKLGAAPVYIAARAGEEGRLFGSVTSSDVARGIEDQLEESVDRHQVRLDEPIRSLGSYSVEVRLHPEVNALVTVEVIAYDEDMEEA